MSIQTIVFVLLAVVSVLFLINVFLIWRFNKTNKKIDALLEAGKIQSFKDVFLRQREITGELEEGLKEAFLKIEELRKISEKTIQKIAVIRFNPFNEIGGNQSFSIAMLDDKNNGFVISSLFTKDGNRVYAKAVKEGKSDFLLSDEEREAIARAISS